MGRKTGAGHDWEDLERERTTCWRMRGGREDKRRESGRKEGE